MPNPPVELKKCCPACGSPLLGSRYKGCPVYECGTVVWKSGRLAEERRCLLNQRAALTARGEALEKAGDALYRRLEDISDDGEAIDQWAALAEGGGS